MSDLVCPKCGRGLPHQMSFCAFCGAGLRDQPLASAAQTAGPNPLVPAPGQREILIGRDPALQGTQHCWLDHPAVSMHHARVEERDGQWFVVDLESHKGTFVNYERVPPSPEGQLLEPNDTLWVAPYAFRLRLGYQRQGLEPAHMRLDAQGLVRTVDRGRTTILDLEADSLAFQPGEFVALVGGSGAGKTTLMKALNGLQPAQKGRVLIDGKPIIDAGDARQFAALHAIMGYVPQDDVMHRDLTAWEVLWYVARLRLADLTPPETRACIEQALGAVDMQDHSGKRVTKLSGGQRKRINIAMELLARPRLLFLDEPTSGLDPGLDLEMMSLMRRWARGDGDGASRDPKTIVLVTHATQNIEQCDYLAFMAPGGKLAFFGPPCEAKTFFFPGRPLEEVTYSHIYLELSRPADGDQTSDAWVNRFKTSACYGQYVCARTPQAALGTGEELLPAARTSRPYLSRAEVRQQAGQFSTLAGRTVRLLFRDRLNAAFLLLQAPIAATLLAAVSSRLALQPVGAVDAKKVLFIMACAAVWLGIINATKEIVKEQPIYQRERLYGLGAAPYVLSRHSILAMLGIVQVVLLVLFVAWQIELPAQGTFLPAIVEMVVTLALSMAAGLALGLLVSSLATTQDLATTLMFLMLILQVIFSGLLFEPEGIASTISVLTLSRWALEGLGTTVNLNQLLVGAVPGYAWDPAYQFSAFHLIQTWGILVVYTLACLTLACWRQATKR